MQDVHTGHRAGNKPLKTLKTTRDEMAAYDRLPHQIRDFFKDNPSADSPVEVERAFNDAVEKIGHYHAVILCIKTLRERL